uniref:CRISPR-associated exonuclease Cas4 n=1 Tax=candidate division WOR-3 bacterium TaxID=2052148 RepID=A0A7C2K4C2_UNCW3
MVIEVEITGTLIWYYYICRREVWLMSRHITPWQENPFIELGRLISKETYERSKKEIKVENVVIDIIKSADHKILVGEVKKSSRFLKSAIMQLAYYLMKLKKYGIDSTGILLFPKEKRRLLISLTREIELELEKAQKDIKELITRESPPAPVKNKFCSKCGYREFCWA